MPEGNRRRMNSWGKLGQVNSAAQAVLLSPPESFTLTLRSNGQMGGFGTHYPILSLAL